jgi:hypothetical protein
VPALGGISVSSQVSFDCMFVFDWLFLDSSSTLLIVLAWVGDDMLIALAML